MQDSSGRTDGLQRVRDGPKENPAKDLLRASAEHPVATPRQRVPLQHLDERGTQAEGLQRDTSSQSASEMCARQLLQEGRKM